MESTTTNYNINYGQPDYPFKHYYHPYLVQFLKDNDHHLVAHRLRVAVVLANTDRLSFRQEVPVQMVEEAIQDELDFGGNELMFYASLGCFKSSELLAEKWNTMEGIHQMLDALYKLFRRM